MVAQYKKTLKRLEELESELANCKLNAGGKSLTYLGKCLEELSVSKEGGEKVKALNVSKEELSSITERIQEIKSGMDEVENKTTISFKELKKINREIDRGLREAESAKNELIKANLRLVVSIAKKIYQ